MSVAACEPFADLTRRKWDVQVVPAADMRQTTCEPEPDLIHQTLFVTAEFDAPRPTERTGRNARHQTFGRFVRTSFSPPPAMRLSRARNRRPTSSAELVTFDDLDPSLALEVHVSQGPAATPVANAMP